MNDKNEKTMNEKYENKIQADVDVIFTFLFSALFCCKN